MISRREVGRILRDICENDITQDSIELIIECLYLILVDVGEAVKIEHQKQNNMRDQLKLRKRKRT